jgi:hypothetical protein
MTNEEFILRFESDTLPDDSFHHVDHVRLARSEERRVGKEC